jgi:hypothetical protein
LTLEMGRLASGQRVIDRYNSHLHPQVLELLPKAFRKIRLTGEQFQVVQVDFDRIVGETTCVVTGTGDLIVYAQRPKRFGLSRFVKDRQPQESRSIVVILKKADDVPSTYVLITAFVGVKPEPEPWDRNKTEQSVAFWSSHALVWDSEPVVPGTETPFCPW